MSGSWLVFFELLLVFGAVFAFGFYELRSLKKYKSKTESGATASATRSAKSNDTSNSLANADAKVTNDA